MSIGVGIDVSKATLDVAFQKGRKTIAFQVQNSVSGFKTMLARARRALGEQDLHWCMEATGSYSFAPALFLTEQGQKVSVENPRRVKNFGLASGALHKTDRADAVVLARYAETMKPGLWRLADPWRAELTFLTRRLAELSALRIQEGNRLEHPGLPSLIREGIQASIAAFKGQEKLIEDRIDQVLKESPDLAEATTLLSTIPGVARRSSLVLLAETAPVQEYESGADMAAALGLHPKLKRSGTSVHGKTRISKAGNAHARRSWYMPAVVAIRVNPIIREFYERLVANHKPKKSALIAAERKLVCIAYGVLKHKKPFDPNHRTLT